LVVAGVESAVVTLVVAVLELRAGVADAVHAGEQRVEQQCRAHAPRARDQRRLPPRLGVPAGRHGPPRDATAGVVVRRARRRGRRRFDFAALDLYATVLGDSARGLLAGQGLE